MPQPGAQQRLINLAENMRVQAKFDLPSQQVSQTVMPPTTAEAYVDIIGQECGWNIKNQLDRYDPSYMRNLAAMMNRIDTARYNQAKRASTNETRARLVEQEAKSVLGILRDLCSHDDVLTQLPEELKKRIVDIGEPLLLSKVQRELTSHTEPPLDLSDFQDVEVNLQAIQHLTHRYFKTQVGKDLIALTVERCSERIGYLICRATIRPKKYVDCVGLTQQLKGLIPEGIRLEIDLK